MQTVHQNSKFTTLKRFLLIFFRYWTSFLRSPLGHFISVSSGGDHVTYSIRHQVFSGLFHLTNDLLSRSRFHDDHVCYSNSKNLEFSNLKKSFTFLSFQVIFKGIHLVSIMGNNGTFNR